MKPCVACLCGEALWVPVKPGPGDLRAIEADVVEAAELLDHALHAGDTITKSSNHARRLADVCRELSLAKAGVLAR